MKLDQEIQNGGPGVELDLEAGRVTFSFGFKLGSNAEQSVGLAKAAFAKALADFRQQHSAYSFAMRQAQEEKAHRDGLMEAYLRGVAGKYPGQREFAVPHQFAVHSHCGCPVDLPERLPVCDNSVISES